MNNNLEELQKLRKQIKTMNRVVEAAIKYYKKNSGQPASTDEEQVEFFYEVRKFINDFRRK